MGPWMAGLLSAAGSSGGGGGGGNNVAPGGYPVNSPNGSGGWNQTGWAGGGGGGFNWGGLASGAANSGSGNSYLDDIHKHGMGGIISGIMNLTNDYHDPNDSAREYINQIEGSSGKYMNPYIDAGKNALGTLQGQYNNLINDPTFMMNKIGAGYQQSPGYQYQVDQATNAANRAGAAGGMLGSPAEQLQLAGNVNQIANQDYGQYLDRGLNQYGMGMQGLGNINQMGYNASSNMAETMANVLQQKAQLAAGSVQNQAQNKAGGWGSIFGAFG